MSCNSQEEKRKRETVVSFITAWLISVYVSFFFLYTCHLHKFEINKVVIYDERMMRMPIKGNHFDWFSTGLAFW